MSVEEGEVVRCTKMKQKRKHGAHSCRGVMDGGKTSGKVNRPIERHKSSGSTPRPRVRVGVFECAPRV